MSAGPKLYDELAAWWPLVSPVAEYEDEARQHVGLLSDVTDIDTLLELGSGGGNVASFLKEHWQLTLVDSSPEMLAVSRRLNPECEHVQDDMRTVRLGRSFDAVLILDAIVHLTRSADVLAALTTAHAHARPGAALLVGPDWTRESFHPCVSTAGADDGARSLRFLEWIFDNDPADSHYEVAQAFMLREAGGPVRVVQDEWQGGLFSKQEWLELCGRAGWDAAFHALRVDSPGRDTTDVIVGRRR